MSTTRASLLRRVRDRGDDLSWRDFVEIYDPLLYRYARLRGLNHENAQEVVQECMTLLVQKMPSFDYARSKGQFKSWLKRIASNKINDMFKRRRPSGGESADFCRPQVREKTQDEMWEAQWRRKHLRYCLKQVLSQVSETTRQAFELHVVSEWPVDRVAETLNISADQVYASKSRITHKLRKRFQELTGDESVQSR